jgi:hypothetical protein
MTADAPGYDAFISYKSSTSRRLAHRLNQDLLTIARRNKGRRVPRIFFDQFTLPPGHLREGLLNAVRASRHLIVLIDREVARSGWVNEEIVEWLAAGGASDRLFLVRTDRKVDLSWDQANNSFRHPEVLPPALTKIFTSEQVYIDYLPWSTRSDGRLARLCAALTGTDPGDFLVAEAEMQRRRNRLTTAVATVLALSLIATAVFAYRSARSEAAAQHNAAEARAAANAADALLTAQRSIPRAIDLVLAAAQESEGPTVRSAMLAVQQEARRLTRAFVYPGDRAGADLSGASFSADTLRFLAWGPGRDQDTSFLQVWDIGNTASLISQPVNVAGLASVYDLNSRVVVGCGRFGPVRLLAATDDDAADVPASYLAGAPWPEAVTSCQIFPVEHGAVVLARRGPVNGVAFYVNRQGSVAAIDGVVTASPDGLVVAGPAGSFFLHDGTWNRLGDDPADRVLWAGSGYAVRTEPTIWSVHVGGVSRTITVPATAVDVDAMPVPHGLELVWVERNGVVGWSGGRTVTQVNGLAPSGWSYATRLRALSDSTVAVVVGRTVTVLRAPGDRSPDWTPVSERPDLFLPMVDGVEPFVGGCRDRQAAFLTDLGRANGIFVVTADGRMEELDGRVVELAGWCDLVAAGSSLILHTIAGGSTVLRESLSSTTVVPSTKPGQFALLAPGGFVEILTTSELDEPWSVATNDSGRPAAFGHRIVQVVNSIDTDDATLVSVADGGPELRTPVPLFSDVVAARPDGMGGALLTPRSERLLLVEGTATVDAVQACGQAVRYVPGPGFDHDIAAAKAQIPVAVVRGKTVDCRTGRPLAEDPPDVLRYEVGPDSGLLVTRAGSTVSITTWRDGSTPRRIDGPPVADEGASVFVADGGDVAAVYDATRQLSLYRLRNGRWSKEQDIVPNLPDVFGAAVVDGGSLVVVVAAAGGFELYDTANGRLLVSDPELSTPIPDQTFVDLTTAQRGDDLFIYLRSARWQTVIRVPIGIPAIAAQLCQIYRSTACPVS